MDSYVDLLQSHGGSMIMLAKGNRSQQVTDACKKHGGFYLGSIGVPLREITWQARRSPGPRYRLIAGWRYAYPAYPACTRDHAHAFTSLVATTEIAGLSGCSTNGGVFRYLSSRWI